MHTEGSFMDRMIQASLYTQFHTTSEMEFKAPKRWETLLAAIVDPIFSTFSTTYNNRKAFLSNRLMLIEEAKKKFSPVTQSADRVLKQSEPLKIQTREDQSATSQSNARPEVQSRLKQEMLDLNEPEDKPVESLATRAPLEYFNEHPEIPLIDIGIGSYAQLKKFIEDHGNQLTSLNLKGFDQVSFMPLDDFQFISMLISCPNLRHIAVESPYLSDESLEALRGLPLRSIEFVGSYYLSNAGLANLKGMPLEKVCFKGCYKLTDGALVHLKGMPLKNVDFSDCYVLTDAGLSNFKGMSLTNIDFSYCHGITDAGLVNFKGMPLKYVGFIGCKVTEEGIEDVAPGAIQKKLDDPFWELYEEPYMKQEVFEESSEESWDVSSLEEERMPDLIREDEEPEDKP